MRYLTDFMMSILFIGTWILGALLADGFWSTFFSITVPPWGWYLIGEWIAHWFPAIS